MSHLVFKCQCGKIFININRQKLSSDPWEPFLEESESFHTYARAFFHYASFCLSTSTDGLRAEAKYPLCAYNSSEKNAAESVFAHLSTPGMYEDKKAGLELFHKFVWSMVTREFDGSTANQFQPPSVQWLIGTNICSNGTFQKAQNVSPTCAKVKYFLRCIHTRQSFETQEEFNSSIFKYVILI